MCATSTTHVNDQPAHPFRAIGPEIPVTIHIPADHVRQLKEDAAQLGVARISTHDALAALI
jgi:hypothetical protein